MRKNRFNEDDPLLESYRRYLLREMDEKEADDFERQLLLEPDLDVEALDSDLIAACARGEIPPEQSRQILGLLTSSPEGRDRRAFLQDLTKLAGETQPRPQTNVHHFPVRTRTGRPWHSLRAALAASLLLAVGGVTAWRVMAPSVAPPPAVFSLTLGTVRGHDQIPQLAVPPKTERVEIRVDVAGEGYPSYNLVLTEVGSGEEVAEESGVLPQTVRGGDVLSLELQASSLQDGEYRLDVYGTEANGPPELVGAPEFAVLQAD